MYGIWCVRAGTSIFGFAQAWLKNINKQIKVFSTKEEADKALEKIKQERTSPNVSYCVKEFEEDSLS